MGRLLMNAFPNSWYGSQKGLSGSYTCELQAKNVRFWAEFCLSRRAENGQLNPQSIADLRIRLKLAGS